MMTSSRAPPAFVAKGQEELEHNDENDDTTTRRRNERHSSTTDVVSSVEWERKVSIVKKYYQMKGYRVHSGLQFGCELVLYVDAPEVSTKVYTVQYYQYYIQYYTVYGYSTFSRYVLFPVTFFKVFDISCSFVPKK